MPADLKIRDDYRRARTDAEKRDRRRAILDASSAYLHEVGFQNFTMSGLSQSAGLAKGTTYLYFSTKEELLLALYEEQVERFFVDLLAAIEPGLDDRAFCRLFLDSARRNPLLLSLCARLGTVIERNVPLESLVGAKRSLRALLERASAQLAPTLRLPPEACLRLLGGFSLLITGGSQNDGNNGPDHSELPADVVEIVEMHRLEPAFMSCAPLMLAGLRAEIAG